MILLKLKILILVFFAIFFVMSANFKYLFATPSDINSFNLSKGYVHGKIALFLATDSSDNQTSVSIESSGHKINYAPLLSALPGEKNYSPLVHLNFIKWNENVIPRLLVSSEEIEQAYLIGEIQIIRTNIIINSTVMVK